MYSTNVFNKCIQQMHSINGINQQSKNKKLL